MRKKATSIPVNNFGGDLDSDILLERISFIDLPNLEAWGESERHDRHSFFLLEEGMVTMEIDFQKHEIKSPAIIYMHPNQVHRMLAFENVTVSCLGINNENLNPEYLKLLEDIVPAKPMLLRGETFSLISEAVSLCLKLSERKHEKLYHSILKDSCNVLVALIASQYLVQAKSADVVSRFDVIYTAFRAALEHHFITAKRPADYAQHLNISIPYLNECVKGVTGQSVSYHIQQRIILEAKRLLYHSDKSVKEIAFALGYDDYPYFSRLFTKVTGTTALAFRSKNLD
jgi:AraC-like DNA-binding protein